LPALAVWTFWLVLAPAAFAQSPTIERTETEFRVLGWKAAPNEPSEGWPSVLAVYAGEGDVPPLLGSYSVDEGILAFQPRYSPAAGVKLRAVFRPPGGAPVEATFEVPVAQAEPSTFVNAIYPSTGDVPDNLLKLYVEFSAPMSRGEAWQRIRLLDDAGTPGDAPFLEIDQELWDPTNTRLTLLFDPGRIKRGVLPREQLGPALIENREYTLVIDAAWRDASDAPLVEEFRKEIRVGPADRTPPEVKDWRLSAPWSRTRDALTVIFPEPMDWALAQRLLAVVGPEGPVRGTIAVESNETRWRFVPDKPWVGGEYQLIVNTALEDLAGNKIGRAFDVDLDQFRNVTERITEQVVSLPFRIDGE
jgi:hypothetical protein